MVCMSMVCSTHCQWWFGIDKHFKYSIWNRPYAFSYYTHDHTLTVCEIQSEWFNLNLNERAHSKDKLHGIFNRSKKEFIIKECEFDYIDIQFAVCVCVCVMPFNMVSSVLLSSIEAFASFHIKLTIWFSSIVFFSSNPN